MNDDNLLLSNIQKSVGNQEQFDSDIIVVKQRQSSTFKD
jgi:hypothetical protein